MRTMATRSGARGGDALESAGGALAVHRVAAGRAARDTLVDIHRAALPNDVLPRLGKRFLGRYFESMLADDSQPIIGAFVDDELVGFCQLSLSPVGIATVLRRQPGCILSIAAAVVRQPAVFRRGLALAFRRSSDTRVPEVSLLAVSALHQRRGIGKQLVRHAMAVAAGRGFDRIHTKTANASARAMYERSFGASVVETYAVGGLEYWCLSWPCTTTVSRPNARS